MARGQDTGGHPNRRVDKESIEARSIADRWVVDPDSALGRFHSTGEVSPEALTDLDDAEWDYKDYYGSFRYDQRHATGDDPADDDTVHLEHVNTLNELDYLRDHISSRLRDQGRKVPYVR